MGEHLGAMAYLMDKRFDQMTIPELKQTCTMLGLNSTPNGKPVLRGQINKELRANGRPNAKTLNEYFGPSQNQQARSDYGAYHVIQSLQGGRNLCLTLTRSRGLVLKAYTGENGQLWRLDTTSFGSLRSKAEPTGRITVADAVSWGEEHDVKYETYGSDEASFFVYNPANNTYQLSAP